ncbi:DUF4192 domain-containing protein [Actinokineospora diospyrosa]|uniref:DUF4192 domain-containing protein n=1 Tax=Actinokineospora diospyrosa TaxID=103728 RepID=A0ABT1I4N1_9PSEU|nr:DUF4192 domain-containing protein [Actinokineospora diospyrosa]MCP2267594.1 protein of unknown function (DUF4192) [Actinokineospora diospyrosa]
MTTTNLHHADQIIAALPYLIGFAPTDSLVALTIRDTREVGPVIRVDLPRPADHWPMAEHLAEILTAHRVEDALLIVVGGREPLHDKPFVHAVTQTLVESGVSVEHAFWTRAVEAGQPWLSYESPDFTGTVADPDSSALAAQFTVQGVVVYPSREAMADSLAADPDADLDRRAALIDELAAHHADDAVADKLALVHQVIEDFDGPPTRDSRLLSTVAPPGPAHTTDPAPTDPDLDDTRLARLAIALSDPEVREACMSIPLGSRDRPAARLWTRLTRSLPAPERAEAAFHLAVGAYLRGDGVYARVALGVALAADPRHSLAALLDSAAHHGIPPTDLRDLIAQVQVKSTQARPG